MAAEGLGVPAEVDVRARVRGVLDLEELRQGILRRRRHGERGGTATARVSVA
jgi:hypothetical protein